jgi:hypothetical protein
LERLRLKELFLADFEHSWLSIGDVHHLARICFGFGAFLLIQLCPSVPKYISALLHQQQCHSCGQNVSNGSPLSETWFKRTIISIRISVWLAQLVGGVFFERGASKGGRVFGENSSQQLPLLRSCQDLKAS